jgi:hypothetical protein
MEDFNSFPSDILWISRTSSEGSFEILAIL